MSAAHTTIQRRLMQMLLLISVVVALLTGGTLIVHDAITFRRQAAGEIASIGKLIAANSTAALAFDNAGDAAEVLATVAADSRILAAGLYERDGSLFAHFEVDDGQPALPPAPGADGARFSPPHLVSVQPVLLAEERIGTLYLRANLAPVYGRLFWYGSLVACVVVLALGVAYVVSRALQRQISEPVVELVRTAREVRQRGDFGVRAVKQRDDELGELTDAFNHMLADLAERDQTLRENEAKITELNAELEARVVRRTAELTAVNQELEAFSYSVSHDLRAPLRHIDGFTQMLKKRVESTIDDTSRRYLNTIMASAQRLGVLIDELLVFSRMGRVEMQRLTVDNAGLVETVRRELEHDINGRDIVWSIDDLPAVAGDPTMLRQVWQNLLGNAVKYTRHRPRAEITVSHRVDPEKGDVFLVRDNGAGFEMQYAHKLFGVFQRLHRDAEFEGTGIGLANVRRMIQRHHGSVGAEGIPGEGATFWFSLPRPRPDP